jgi:hypothetical protein
MDDRASTDVPAPGDRPAGERVGNYTLVRRIGAGAMGEVWLGRHLVSGTLGAVKRIAPHARADAGVVAAVRREGRAIARLGHPHIVPVFELGDDYLVSAFIDGANLARRLHTPIEPAAAIRTARQIADALAHAHERGIVHRDVKPSNILIDERGNAYLADFGLALFAEDAAAGQGFVTGTVQFMAPEQRAGERIGPAADQYALGRTLIEMLVGGAVPLDPAAALRELPTALPPALMAALARATAPAAADRFPSVSAFADALGAIPLGELAPPRRTAPELRRRDGFGWLAGAVRVTRIGPEIERADHRVRALAEAGLLPAPAVAALLDELGVADLGFALWCATGRLGALTQPQALARASDLVVLLHGLGHTREVWPAIASAVCRDNAQAMVLALDLPGFGESRFTGVPTRDQVGPLAIARAVDALRQLLGLATVPTALVGHSMSGLALLTIDDTEAGARVSRVAINPILASHDPRIRRTFRWQAWAINLLGRIAPLLRFVLRAGSRFSREAGLLTPEAVKHLVEEIVRHPGRVIAALMRGVADAPTRLGRHRRAALIACVDDPWLDQAVLARAIADVGLEPAQVHHMASGGHHPHLETAAHPEWSARNHADIVHIIDSMLITAAQPTVSGRVEAASTMPRGANDYA